MDSHGWRVIYHILRAVSRSVPRPGRRPRYSDLLIVAMLIWAASHDRPMSWACRRSSYHGPFRPRRLPSCAQFSRRLRTESVLTLLQKVFERLAGSDQPTPVCFLDARPFVVGSCSKDRQARAGRIYGGFARGYKLHAIVTEDRRVLCWSVEPLNVDERVVAETLIAHVKPHGLLLADGNYDSGKLHDQVATHGGQLLTPVSAGAGTGHCRQSAARLAGIAGWRWLGRYIYRDRIRIEQCFAHQSTFGGGLGPLPTWVRTLPRVRRWVGAKLIIYHARLHERRTAA